MARLTNRQDAFGCGIYEFHLGHRFQEYAQRDDGLTAPSGGPDAYFAEFKDWPTPEKRAIRLARGRCLDVGCGAGRVALHLQRAKLDTVGIDNSPLAVKVCKLRGLKAARVLPIEEVGPRLGRFDTIVMFGNNFGLFGGFRKARRLLARFHDVTTGSARILAGTLDPYQTGDAGHLKYHELNRSRGRMGGQVRIRIVYDSTVTPWFDYLFVSQPEMEAVLSGTGWRVSQYFEADGPRYVALIEKERPQPGQGAGAEQ